MQLDPGDWSGRKHEDDYDEGDEDYTRERTGRGRIECGSGSGTGTGSDDEYDFELRERELEAGGCCGHGPSRPTSRASRAHTQRCSPERALPG